VSCSELQCVAEEALKITRRLLCVLILGAKLCVCYSVLQRVAVSCCVLDVHESCRTKSLCHVTQIDESCHTCG